MVFLRIFGWLMVITSVIGFLIGLAELNANGLLGINYELLAISGLLVGIYLGTLGIKVDGLLEGKV